MNTFIEKALNGTMDSDRHLVSIFAMALASRGKVFIELGGKDSVIHDENWDDFFEKGLVG